MAAVQAQMISFTYQSNNIPAQTAVNALFFTGLVLDVMGASIGLVNGVLYQRYKLRLVQLQTSMEDIPKTVESIRDLESEALESRSPESLEKNKTKLMDIWRIEQQRTLDFYHLIPIMQLTGASVKKLDTSIVSKMMLFYSRNINPIITAASSATTTIGLGICCFFIGLCIFVVDTQPFRVSFVTIFVLGASICSCCGPLLTYI